MLARRYVSGISVEGLEVRTSGLSLTIGPGSIAVPEGTAMLTEPVTFTFPPAAVPSDIAIGFDLLGRIFVERHDRGQPSQAAERLVGTMVIYVWFTLEPTTTDLSQVMINVKRPAINL